MPTGLLDIFKYVLIALIWLFFFRVLRAVWVQVKPPSARRAAAPAAPAHANAKPPAKAAPAASSPPAQGRSKALQVRLESAGSAQKRVFDIGASLTIGRASSCGIALPQDEFSSTVHARIFADDGVFYVEDLGSTNGTFLNGRRISSPSKLSLGDKVVIGRSQLEVVS